MVTNTINHWGRPILNFDVDWMDQAKHPVPHNTSMNKQFADTWRPQLGAQGITEESLMVTNTINRWGRTILNFDADWMDQAKFRCPRNTSMNKQFADMWRPQLGARGVTMDGVGSFVFLTDFDVGKR